MFHLPALSHDVAWPGRQDIGCGVVVWATGGWTRSVDGLDVLWYDRIVSRCKRILSSHDLPAHCGDRDCQGDAEVKTMSTAIDQQQPITAAQLKVQITSLLDTLPDPELAAVLDFVQLLAEREQQAAWMNAQSQSAAYQEWLDSGNDIYDEVFADAVSTR
jgi:hypothetical protein